jgi:hypothetical protein
MKTLLAFQENRIKTLRTIAKRLGREDIVLRDTLLAIMDNAEWDQQIAKRGKGANTYE